MMYVYIYFNLELETKGGVNNNNISITYLKWSTSAYLELENKNPIFFEIVVQSSIENLGKLLHLQLSNATWKICMLVTVITR